MNALNEERGGITLNQLDSLKQGLVLDIKAAITAFYLETGYVPFVEIQSNFKEYYLADKLQTSFQTDVKINIEL